MSRYTTKRQINDKSIGSFKTLFSLVDWKHVLNENSTNKAYKVFLRIILGFYGEAVPKLMMKTSGLVKSSKKKQRSYKK